MVDITGLEKADVLKALYDASHPLGLGRLDHRSSQPLPLEEARRIITKLRTIWAERLPTRWAYFDYLQGRVLKVNLTGDEFDETLYDRDNGPGAAEQALASIRVTT